MSRNGARFFASVCVAILLVFAVLAGLTAAVPPPRRFVITPQDTIEPARLPVWYRLSGWVHSRRHVLLTFDDGPYGGGVDEQILQILRRHHAHALFFLVCNHITPATIRVPQEILATGNLIGNHSYDHQHIAGMKPAELQREVGGCSNRLQALTGKRPKYFRPPFGERSPQLLRAINSAGMKQVLWTANSQDSWLARPGEIVHWSLEETEDGSILLMHSKPATAKALNRVLTALESEGFKFVLPAEELHPDQRN